MGHSQNSGSLLVPNVGNKPLFEKCPILGPYQPQFANNWSDNELLPQFKSFIICKQQYATLVEQDTNLTKLQFIQ